MGHSSIVDLLSKAKESREVIVIPSQLLMPKGNDDPEGDSADVFEL